MMITHHPDCECRRCLAHQDAYCAETAVATADVGRTEWRVCQDHGRYLIADDICKVQFDAV